MNAGTGTVLMRRNATCRRIYIALNTNSSHPVISNTIGQLQLGKPQNSEICLLAIRLFAKHYYRRFASVTEIVKYVEKLLLFACLVFSRTLCQTVYKLQASSFDKLSFFPRAGLLCLCIGQIEASTCPPGHTPGI